jgi:RNA polymerase sigma-70 factor (ECF subfamily)
MNERPVASGRPLSAAQADRLSALFEAHADRLYRLARRLVPSAEDAWDLLQEAFLKAARSLESIPPGLTNEEAWLVRVLVNVRRDHWRKEAVRKRHQVDLHHAAAESDDPEGTFLIRTVVWRALDYLPPRRRAVVVMHEIDGLSIAAIAALLGISAITVRWHLSRGRRELARRLRIEVGDIDDEQPQKALAGRGPASSRTIAP